VNIYFCSYSVLHGEIHFFNDVARDFLLLREIDAKKIMLIGPRSNASGLFHGPLWSYINYPVYRLGGGNPVVNGWFWILLSAGSLGIGFFYTKKLFGTVPGLAFVLLCSYSLIPQVNGMFHSSATILLTPLLIFSIIQYVKSCKFKYLAFHIFIVSMIFQLNIGVGMPLFILSGLLCLYLVIRRKSWKHLSVFLLIPVLLSNFIIFDLRHDFFMTKSAIVYSEFQRTWKPLSTGFFLKNRIETTVDLHIIQTQNPLVVNFIFFSVILFSIFQIRKSRKDRTIYLLILYYYFGYMLLTFANKGVILMHFVYFLIPLTVLWFVSFLRGSSQFLFFPILVIAIFMNSRETVNYLNYLNTSFMEKRPESWRSTNLAAEAVIKRNGSKPFGYFVFSPDAFAYGPRYAMIYHFKKAHLDAREYTKMATTYVIASPPPDNDPYMTYVWWVKNPVKITTEPVWTEKFGGGYTALEYKLSEKEQLIPHDKTIELGIHFR